MIIVATKYIPLASRKSSSRSIEVSGWKFPTSHHFDAIIQRSGGTVDPTRAAVLGDVPRRKTEQERSFSEQLVVSENGGFSPSMASYFYNGDKMLILMVLEVFFRCRSMFLDKGPLYSSCKVNDPDLLPFGRIKSSGCMG